VSGFANEATDGLPANQGVEEWFGEVMIGEQSSEAASVAGHLIDVSVWKIISGFVLKNYQTWLVSEFASGVEEFEDEV